MQAPALLNQNLCWRYLSSQAVASQVLWTEMSLTTVFGMGTGGSSPSLTPTLPFYLGRIYSVYTSYEGVPSKPNNTQLFKQFEKTLQVSLS